MTMYNAERAVARVLIAKVMYEAPIDGNPGTWPPGDREDMRFWLERADALLTHFNITPREDA